MVKFRTLVYVMFPTNAPDNDNVSINELCLWTWCHEQFFNCIKFIFLIIASANLEDWKMWCFQEVHWIVFKIHWIIIIQCFQQKIVYKWTWCHKQFFHIHACILHTLSDFVPVLLRSFNLMDSYVREVFNVYTRSYIHSV